MKKPKGCLGYSIIVLVVILAAALIFAFVQRNNISAIINGSKYSEDDIQQQITDNKKEVEDQLEEYNVSGLRDFTFEEEEAIRKGELSVEEAMDKIIEESNPPVQNTDTQNNSSQPSGQNNTNNTSPQAPVNNASAIVSEYTIKLYTLKANYLGQLGNVIDQAKAEYKKGASKRTIMSEYLGTAASLEKEADSQVDSLLNELTGKLKAIGADTSIVSTMRNSYESEKSLKKSYYLSVFSKKSEKKGDKKK